MSINEPTAVVVGIDTSKESRPALAYAVHTALLRRSPLEIVHFWDTEDEEQTAQEAVDTALGHAKRIVKGAVPVVARSLPGSPVSGLVDASMYAAVIVVGRGRYGGVADQVAQRAHAPVALVPPVWAAPGKTRCITVAVDATDRGANLLEVAFRAAALEGDSLTVLHVWRPDNLQAGALARIGGPDWYPFEECERREQLEKIVAATAERFPGVRHAVEIEPALAPPADALAEASEWSVLVIVGRRDQAPEDRGPRSVAIDLAQRAFCPVLVVPSGTASSYDAGRPIAERAAR